MLYTQILSSPNFACMSSSDTVLHHVNFAGSSADADSQHVADGLGAKLVRNGVPELTAEEPDLRVSSSMNRLTQLTSVKSMLCRKPVVAAWRRTVCALGFFHAEQICDEVRLGLRRVLALAMALECAIPAEHV
jgi:hypothetical protein